MPKGLQPIPCRGHHVSCKPSTDLLCKINGPCVSTKSPFFFADVQQSTLFLCSNTTPRWPQAAPQTGLVWQVQRKAALLREHVQLQIHRLADFPTELCLVMHQYVSWQDLGPCGTILADAIMAFGFDAFCRFKSWFHVCFVFMKWVIINFKI